MACPSLPILNAAIAFRVAPVIPMIGRKQDRMTMIRASQ
jgi:hypothetical protein